MRKILVTILIVAMISAISCAAVAETKKYVLSVLKDAEGNTLVSVSDDLSRVTDGYGNDITDEWTMLYFEYDDETMTGAFGTEGNQLKCTLEPADSENDLPAYTATMENGEVITVYYDQENDIFTYDDPNGQNYTMVNIG